MSSTLTFMAERVYQTCSGTPASALASRRDGCVPRQRRTVLRFAVTVTAMVSESTLPQRFETRTQ